MNPRVLIVDDSLTVRMDLADALSAAGFEPTPCGTAAAAREALAKHVYRLVVLDVRLPDGDGVEILAELKSAPRTAAIPVMMLSSDGEIRDRIRGLRTGADEYVGKPYDISYVIARARELVRSASTGPRDGAELTVLIIDDSVTSREQFAEALLGAGYAVVTAATGEDGLRRAVDLHPAAIIVDGMLPGIDGAAVVQRVRADATLRRTLCLLLTESTERSQQLRALEAGADAYVLKSEGVDVVLARLAAALRSAPPRPSIAAASSLLSPKRILAVDDSPTFLAEAAAHLREYGYEVISARSGEEALALLEVQSVDCVLLDLIMPGLSGQETCHRIKGTAAWRDLPVVMLTSREGPGVMIESINAGADDYIAKSSDFEVLRARLHAQLRRRQFEDENRSIREQLLIKELEASDARATREVALARAALLDDLAEKNQALERANSELEAFSYSVSHDLRAPLRAIDGFSSALEDDCAAQLDAQGLQYLAHVRRSAQRMGELIDDLLQLARLTRGELHSEPVDLTAVARGVFDELRVASPDRVVDSWVQDGVTATGDARLLRAVLENLLGNAWKFTSTRERPRIEFGVESRDGESVYFVRDTGVGFEMKYVEKLFRAFQRLHTVSEFEGTGIGLATVQRIIHRHGGRVWAESELNIGTAIHFVLGSRTAPHGATGS